jgi:hypothetical protein
MRYEVGANMSLTNGITAAAGAIVGVAAAIGVIWRLALPHIKGVVASEVRKLADVVGRHTAEIDDLNEKKVKDFAAIQASNARHKAVFKALIALLEYAETGVSNGNIKLAKRELETWIIDNM